MIHSRHSRQRGFTLVELAIVLGVVAVITAAIWNYAASAKQTAKIEQAAEEVSLLVDGTRAAYASAASIRGGTVAVMNFLISTNALPTYLLRTTQTACQANPPATYADSPWGEMPNSGCGTLQVCSWNYGTNVICQPNNPNNQQYFAVQFNNLNYASCVSLAERISSTMSPGLQDIYINKIFTKNAAGQDIGSMASANSTSVSSTTAAANCTPGLTTNVVDFVYNLRAPLS